MHLSEREFNILASQVLVNLFESVDLVLEVIGGRLGQENTHKARLVETDASALSGDVSRVNNVI